MPLTGAYVSVLAGGYCSVAFKIGSTIFSSQWHFKQFIFRDRLHSFGDRLKYMPGGVPPPYTLHILTHQAIGFSRTYRLRCTNLQNISWKPQLRFPRSVVLISLQPNTIHRRVFAQNVVVFVSSGRKIYATYA